MPIENLNFANISEGYQRGLMAGYNHGHRGGMVAKNKKKVPFTRSLILGNREISKKKIKKFL